jgi:glutamine synthetase
MPLDLEQILKKIHHHKQFILKSILENFQSQKLNPIIGVELEFYLRHQGSPVNQEITTQFISHLKLKTSQHNIQLLGIDQEQGLGQIEVRTAPYSNIHQLCQDISKIKEFAEDLNDDDLQVSFLSQPYKNDCGSSLQLNFSLTKNGKFLFAKNGNEESKYLTHSISSVLNYTKNMMIIFAPNCEDYLRFNLELNRDLHKKKKYTAPVNISWGYNNRTALIRIPHTRNDSERRLEFRLGASSADIYLMIAFFLLAILQGLEKCDDPKLEIYGNAFDEQYDLEPLPRYEEAKNYFLNNSLMDKILSILSASKLD